MQEPRTRNQVPQAASVRIYLEKYLEKLREALLSVSGDKLEAAVSILKKTIETQARVYVAGNGGSAAIADHLCCDWMKGTYTAGKPTLMAHSMMANVSLLTAISNDFGYEQGISRQVEMLGKPGDVLVLVSSSGNSVNIVRAIEAARSRKMTVLGFSGFQGGKLAEMADLSIHVPVDNYGIAEDSHQILMHVFSQFLAAARDLTP
jgi:D-sedoheptulose 7-phosphate isomerase